MHNKAVEFNNILGNYKEILSIKYIKAYKKSKSVEIAIKPLKVLKSDEINNFKNHICSLCKASSIDIKVEYDNLLFGKDEFINTYWDMIKDLVFEKNPGFIGFLKNSIVKFKDNNITIVVSSKVIADSLIIRKCDSIFEKIIKDFFNIEAKILIDYDESLEPKKDFTSLIVNEENKIITQTLKNLKQDTEKQKRSEFKKSDQNGNIIFGKSFSDEPILIDDINEEIGTVVIQGEVFNVEVKELNSGRKILTFNITDYSNSIKAKILTKEDNNYTNLINSITEGKYIKLKGDVQLDPFIKELVVRPIAIIEISKEVRMDNSERKRVELHAHTGMSAMDSVCSATDLFKRAKEWGHKAVAITDHGVVQAFPEAYEASKKTGVKAIYGVEGYLVNDGTPIVYNACNRSLETSYVVFDIETTGLSAANDKIIEIGAVKLYKGKIVDKFTYLINPEIEIPPKIVDLTGIKNEMVADKPTIREVLPKFIEFVRDSILVAHNALFDWGFINLKSLELGYNLNNTVIDTLQLSRSLLPELKKHKLDIVCKHFGINLENHHRALDDAMATAEMFEKLLEMIKEKQIDTINEINSITGVNLNIKTGESYHIILLVKNYIGLRNLYKLISISHLDFFYKRPRIPKSILLQYREGLIIGSACEAGEIYRAVLNGENDEIVKEKAKLYDYLEIQPNGNNEFLIKSGRVKGHEELENINKKIVQLGKIINKPVVATGDVHFLEPKDEIYRRIIMAGQGYSDADDQAPLYFKTTEEMLEEFSYLGEKLAYEVVVENTNKILEQVEDIIPIPEETFPPKIEGSEEQIREMTINKAHEIYGEILPEVVEKRLEKELNSIINNGYAVMYLIAQKLVAKSLSDGYLVGSRGSVGSSFVATMCNITEVNPLPPHYVCPKCKYSYFYTDGSIGSGADLPDANCPKCNEVMIKDGHDIPFEIFLGFDGDKEPDIDLNFAGEYQATAHKYTEELFGKGYVYRAGTIGTIAEKTAFGFIKKYYEERNLKLSKAEAERLVKGCTGVKRTTGQHPGGVMIVPSHKEIFEFTPIQRPADDTTSNVITTHFDYHSISGRLLKLDILGHDVPTIIRMLEDMTGVNARTIKLDDKKTMSLFTSTEAMNIDLDDIDCKVGSLGIPEFGTKFVRQMLMDTKPSTFAELVRIAGLSHGTDVWLNNAQDLIRNGIATLKEVISTRDDIMLYLIYSGVNPKTSFKIAENVRKGKGLTPEYEEALREKNIPEWYINSCKTVKYLFPKAHATAYVMMSFRIAYYKVYYPEAFYATFYTVRIEDFDAELFVKGKEMVKAKWEEIEKKGSNATAKEKNLLTLLEVVYEMYQRGIKLLKVDLYKSAANKFLLTDEGILPPFNSLQGVGISAAENIVNAREQGEFISIEDLRERTKVSKTVIEILKIHGCLDGLPENNQLSLF